MAREFKSFEEIGTQLKVLKLNREIALEELKLAKNAVSEQMRPPKWTDSTGLLKFLGELGVKTLLKKWLKK